MYTDKSISLQEEQQSTLCSAILGTNGQLRDSSEFFTAWETVNYSMFTDTPAFSISFWPSLAAQIIGAFQWLVEYTGFLQLPGCTCQVHSAGQINSCNCCIYGARLMSNLLCATQSHFTVAHGQGQTHHSGLHQKHEMSQRPSEPQAGCCALTWQAAKTPPATCSLHLWNRGKNQE